MAKKKRKVNKSGGIKRTVPKNSNQKLYFGAKKSSYLIIVIGIIVTSLAAYWYFYKDNSYSDDQKRVEKTKIFIPQTKKVESSNEPTFDDFVGSEVCAGCHQPEYDVWKNSTHGVAGGSPDNVNVIGQFDGIPRHFKDAIVTPSRDDKNNLSFKVEIDNQATKTYKVDEIVGAARMSGGGSQTYFSKFPDGTLRFLPFDFIRDKKVWFGETKNQGWLPIDKQLSITELSEWPPSRILGHEPNTLNCQECHGSQIQTTYNLSRKQYETRYKTLRINCESCHGPGKNHVNLAKTGKIQNVEEIGMVALATLNKDESLMVCFQCHALKDALKPGYLPGKDLQDYYSLKLPILGENPYFADGRIRKFGYQQNHLFSDCYINGSMSCIDCHNPHSQDYRDINGRRLEGKFDNGQCTSCHPSKAIEPEQHTRHKQTSSGSLCTSCHMPFLQHKAMGSQLRFARSDHTIPIPRPVFDKELGIENACKQCHKNKTNDWLQAKVTEWYGEIKPHKPIIVTLQNIVKSKNTDSDLAMLLTENKNPLAKLAVLSYIIENKFSPDMPVLDIGIIETLKKLSHSEDIDLKSFSLMALHYTSSHKKDVQTFVSKQISGLGRDEMPVRRRLTVALGYLAGQFRDRGDTRKAILTFKKALEILPNDPNTLQNLGITYQNAGDYVNALANFGKANSLDSGNANAQLNLGLTYSKMGDSKNAELTYRNALQINPFNKLINFNLGNAAYRSNNLDEAIEYYKKSVGIDPSFAPGYFSLTRSFIKKNEFQEARLMVIAGLFYDPQNQTGKAMLRDLNNFLKK